MCCQLPRFTEGVHGPLREEKRPSNTKRNRAIAAKWKKEIKLRELRAIDLYKQAGAKRKADEAALDREGGADDEGDEEGE